MAPKILAQAIPETGTALLMAVAIVVAVGGLAYAANQVLNFWRAVRGPSTTAIAPNPLNIQTVPQFVPRSDFEILVAAVGRTQEQIAHLERSMREDNRRDSGVLHDKINGIAREVSEQSAKQETFTQQMIHVETKLDRLIERGGV